MNKRKPTESSTPRLLTEAELPLMQILWRHEGASANQVLDELKEQGRQVAYTTVSTLLRILEQKGAVKSEKLDSGRAHRYVPLYSKVSYETRTVQHLLSTVFAGDLGPMVARLLESKDLNEAQLTELKALVRKAGKGDKP